MTDATTDLQGRPYAKLSNLQPGDIIIVDDSFADTDCKLKKWSEHKVKQLPPTEQEDYDGDLMLYISCAAGRHMLDGQLTNDGDTLIGIYRKEDYIAHELGQEGEDQ